MSESLTEFISRRRLEIEEEEGPLKEHLRSLMLEKVQLRKAAIAAGIEDKPLAEPDRPRITRKVQTGTIKEAVIAILAEAGEGMTAGDLLVRLNERNNSALIRSSLSPQLSRLKQEGHIFLTGRIWHLAEQTPKEIEPSDHNLFEGNGSEGSKLEIHAKDREAGSGGGG